MNNKNTTSQINYNSNSTHNNENDFTSTKDGNVDTDANQIGQPINILICYFSGTNNTKKIVDLYVKYFKTNNCNIDIHNIEKGNFDGDLNQYNLLGIAYPIHAFNAPEIVVNFVKTIKKQSNKTPLFIIKTSGEPLAINNISSIKIRKILKRKNFELTNEYHYIMPYNILFRHSDNMVYKMWNTAQKLVPIHCYEILNNINSKLKYIFAGSAVAWIFRIQHWGDHFNGKKYKVSDKCIKCQKCINSCPTHNITIKDGEFHFGNKCIMCMRCSFFCPSNAIKIGLFNNWKVNGEYNFDNFNIEEDLHKNFCKKSYKKYFEKSQAKIKSFNEMLNLNKKDSN